MRNNWMKRILTAACIMALLTGCGAKTPADTQQPGEEPAPETPAQPTAPTEPATEEPGFAIIDPAPEG